MALRPSGGHDHEIGDGGFAVEIDGDGVLGFHVVETGEDSFQSVLRTDALGHDFGR